MNWINEAVAAFIKTIEKAEAEAEAEARAEVGIEDGEERDMSDQGNWTDEEFEAYWEAEQEAEKHDNFATRYELNIEEIMAERRQRENEQELLAMMAKDRGRPLTRKEKSLALTALAEAEIEAQTDSIAKWSLENHPEWFEPGFKADNLRKEDDVGKGGEAEPLPDEDVD